MSMFTLAISCLTTPYLAWFMDLTRESNGNTLQYSFLENPLDRGAWKAAVHGVARSWTQLSNFTFTFHFHALEEEMGTHSSVLAWRIPGTGEPGGLPSMGSHRVRHDWSNLAAVAVAAIRNKIKHLITVLGWNGWSYFQVSWFIWHGLI